MQKHSRWLAQRLIMATFANLESFLTKKEKVLPLSHTTTAADIPQEAPPLRGPLQVAAQVWSYIAHPLFVPGAIAAWILMAHPLNGILLDEGTRLRWLVMILLNTILFPALVTFLLWRLGFTSGMQLPTQRERIIPLVVSIIFYFWAWNVSRNLTDFPPMLVQWLLGIFLSSSAAMFVNIFMKISLHGIAMGGLIAFNLYAVQADPMYWPLWMLQASLLAAGITGTARLLRRAHTPGQLYGGYLAGIICQVVAMWVYA